MAGVAAVICDPDLLSVHMYIFRNPIHYTRGIRRGFRTSRHAPGRASSQGRATFGIFDGMPGVNLFGGRQVGQRRMGAVLLYGPQTNSRRQRQRCSDCFDKSPAFDFAHLDSGSPVATPVANLGGSNSFIHDRTYQIETILVQMMQVFAQQLTAGLSIRGQQQRIQVHKPQL